MTVVEGIFGRKIRITDERWNHILENHPEMKEELQKITETLQFPDEVIESKTDNLVTLYYKKYFKTIVGDKWMCVLVKDVNHDAFMLTAYFTDKVKNGTLIWKKK